MADDDDRALQQMGFTRREIRRAERRAAADPAKPGFVHFVGVLCITSVALTMVALIVTGMVAAVVALWRFIL